MNNEVLELTFALASL